MMRGRELAAELVDAIGAPLENCVSVDLDTPTDGPAVLTLKYTVTPNLIIRAGRALKAKEDFGLDLGRKPSVG